MFFQLNVFFHPWVLGAGIDSGWLSLVFSVRPTATGWGCLLRMRVLESSLWWWRARARLPGHRLLSWSRGAGPLTPDCFTRGLNQEHCSLLSLMPRSLSTLDQSVSTTLTSNHQTINIMFLSFKLFIRKHTFLITQLQTNIVKLYWVVVT